MPPEVRLGAISRVAALRRRPDPVLIVIETAHKRSLRCEDAAAETGTAGVEAANAFRVKVASRIAVQTPVRCGGSVEPDPG